MGKLKVLFHRKHANKEIDGKGNPRTKPEQGKKDEKLEENDTKKDLKELVTCDVCGMKYDTVTQAIQHKFRKHPESSVKFYCPYCGMQFPLKVIDEKYHFLILIFFILVHTRQTCRNSHGNVEFYVIPMS